ncbi:hypothetical protein KCU67_g3960, partial [Aureobasidium melanogenum]
MRLLQLSKELLSLTGMSVKLTSAYLLEQTSEWFAFSALHQVVNNMSSSRPRPSMQQSVYYKWLWCNENSKVNVWFLNMPEHHNYRVFYASFINAANRAWELGRHSNSTLQPLDLDMIACLLEEHIPAEMIIDALKKYNHLVGGNKGDLKIKGLVKMSDGPPELSTIEAAVEELKKKVKATRAIVTARYANEQAKDEGKGKGKAKVANDYEDEDEEMEDAEEYTMSSLNDMNTELTAAGNAPAAVKNKGKGKAPVEFGGISFVGGKKKDDD